MAEKISRDSVMIEISNTTDSTLKFWINNGRKEYHRFWAVNKLGDSIGTWIQVAPPGNTIRFYVDDDVYRSKMDLKKARAKKFQTVWRLLITIFRLLLRANSTDVTGLIIRK